MVDSLHDMFIKEHFEQETIDVSVDVNIVTSL